MANYLALISHLKIWAIQRVPLAILSILYSKQLFQALQHIGIVWFADSVLAVWAETLNP